MHFEQRAGPEYTETLMRTDMLLQEQPSFNYRGGCEK